MKKHTITLPGGGSFDLTAVKCFPPGVCLWGEVIGINIGVTSPDWVNELNKTALGKKLLRLILVGLLKEESLNEIYKEIEEASFQSIS